MNQLAYDADGRFVARRDAAGNDIGIDDELALDAAFAGRLWDADTRLYNHHARWRDHRTGRFLSEDPAGLDADTHLYRYAAGDPVNYADPTGLIQAGHPLAGLGTSLFQPAVDTSFLRTSSFTGNAFSTPTFSTPSFSPSQPASLAPTSRQIVDLKFQPPAATTPAFRPSGNAVADTIRKAEAGLPITGGERAGLQAELAFNTPNVRELRNTLGVDPVTRAGSAGLLNVSPGPGPADFGGVLDTLQLSLDGAGLAPVLGIGPDLVNAGISFGRGDNVGGAASLFAAVPVVGTLGPLAKVARAADNLPGSGIIDVSPPISKNSLDYVGETHVYRVKGPNGTHKIGESAQGTRVGDGASIRAEQQVRKLNPEVGDGHSSQIRKTFPDKRFAREHETNLIERFRRMFGDDALPGNKTNR